MLRKLRDCLSEWMQGIRSSYLRFAGIDVGKNTFISFGAWIDVARGKVVIGSNCTITKGCKVLSHSAIEKLLRPDAKQVSTETVIEDNVFVGMNAIILPNVRIGRNSIVGAGAVVTKDVPADSVIAGNPARVIRRYNKETRMWERVVGNADK